MNSIEAPKPLDDSTQKIVGQYRAVVGSLNGMFQAARVRIVKEEWRRDGVGSCVQIHSKEESEQGLFGPAGKQIISLREALNQEVGGRSVLTGCPYHRTNTGCVLGDLKAPVCIQYFDQASRSEWEEKFGLNTQELRLEIGDTLNYVLVGHDFDSVVTEDYRTRRVAAITKRIEQEPVIFGGNKIDKIRVFWQKLKGFPKRLYRHWTWTHA